MTHVTLTERWNGNEPPTLDVEVQPQYQERLATCLATGHTPVKWELPDGKRVLCLRCGHTFPSHWLRLVTMAGVEPIGDKAESFNMPRMTERGRSPQRAVGQVFLPHEPISEDNKA